MEGYYSKAKSSYTVPTSSFMLRYPIVSPRDNCAGNLPNVPGVRSYGLRPASEHYDVFCYVERLGGEEPTHELLEFTFKVNFNIHLPTSLN